MSTEDDPPAGSQPPPSSEVAPASTPPVSDDAGGSEPRTGIGRPFDEPPVADDGDNILPATLDDDALRKAVGPAPKRRRARTAPVVDDAGGDDAEDGPRRSRRMIAVIAVSIIVGLGITALVLLGRVNTERYFLACKTTQAVAERGRSFPPWGSRPLSGAEWRPITLPPNAQCMEEELDSRTKLEARFLEVLLERTSAALTVRNFLESLPEGTATPNPLDTIAAQLEQALLLSRAPERGDQRKQVERLLGDVQYWRASLRLRDATTALLDAAKQFDAAALQRPLHVSDAGAWAEFLRRLGDELRAGPTGVPAAFPPAPTTADRPTAPQGTALPVEPEPDADGSAAPATPPDAGVPTGGVLL